MLEPETQEEIISLIAEEARRIQFGKIFVEVTVMSGHATNIQAETKRSRNLNRPTKQR